MSDVNFALNKKINFSSSVESWGWGNKYLTDGRETSDLYFAKGFSSNGHLNPICNEWVEIDLGNDQIINQFKLYPRTDCLSVNGLNAGFPVDYTIQVKKGAGEYKIVKTITNQQDTKQKPVTIEIENTSARFVKIDATKLGNPPSDEKNLYRLQFAEIEIYNIPKEIIEPVISIIEMKKLQIHFINVGYGDCIIIQTPNNKSILIDTGDSAFGIKVVNYIKALNISTIDIFISTHPHIDHASNNTLILNAFTVKQIYLPNMSNYATYYATTISLAKSKAISFEIVGAGKSIDFDDMKLEFFAPVGLNYADINNSSIVFKLTYANNSFLFTGDASVQSQGDMLSSKYNLKSDVLKVPHHGKWDSGSQAFIDAILPEYAVISTSDSLTSLMAENGGTTKLMNAKIPTYVTSMNGNIIIASSSISVKAEHL